MTEPEVIVHTAHGSVRGVENGGMLIWRGIPYAAAPVGDLRFRPPAPLPDWTGIRDTTELPAVAWQSPPPPGMPPPADGVVAPGPDEDCLFLSISRPSGPVPAGGLPVLVWIHGGGYATGSSLLDTDGAALARHGIVVVSIAYRLASFGFLHLGDLLTGYPGSGCAGLLDQLQALRWVKANIAGFGGNPGLVTLYGVSAGGKSVANILSLPESKTLVHRAISSSGGGEHVATIAQAVQIRSRFLVALGLTEQTAHLLTSVAAAEMLAAQEVLGTGGRATWLWRPVLDDTVLHHFPIQAIENGSAAGIPMLIGNNGNEGVTFALFEPSAVEQSGRVLPDLFGHGEAAAIRAAYRVDDPEIDERGIDISVLSSERYVAPTTRLADAQSQHAKVWRYRYDLTAPGVPELLNGGHGMDSPAVWSAHRWEADSSPRAQTSLALNAAVSTFAQGSPPTPGWPRYTDDDRATMILDSTPHVEHDPRPAERLAWQNRRWESGTWWDIDDLGGTLPRSPSA